MSDIRWSFEIPFKPSKLFAREGEKAKGELETTLPKEVSREDEEREVEEDRDAMEEEGEEEEVEERERDGEHGRPAIH